MYKISTTFNAIMREEIEWPLTGSPEQPRTFEENRNRTLRGTFLTREKLPLE